MSQCGPLRLSVRSPWVISSSGCSRSFWGAWCSAGAAPTTPRLANHQEQSRMGFLSTFLAFIFETGSHVAQVGLYLTVTEACLWLPTTSQALASQACTIPPGSHFLKSVHLEARAGGDVLSPQAFVFLPRQIVLILQTLLFSCTMTRPGKK